MIKHSNLRDPIKRTREMSVDEFLAYVKIREEQGEGEQTNPEVVRRVHEAFYATWEPQIRRGALDAIWEFVQPKLEANAGLTAFTLDYDGAKSEFFFPWLMAVFTSPSTALEMSYGAGFDLLGRWVPTVPEDDPIDTFVRNDPTFVYNRERQLFTADLVSSVLDKTSKRAKAKVIDLGAGRMAWARWHGFRLEPSLLKILAYDKDTTINPRELFSANPEWLGVFYKHCDMRQALTLAECREADLAILGGVATYYPLEMFVETVIKPVYGLLKSGGAFFFDVQVDCPYLRRSMRIFDWPEMRLQPSAEAAIAALEKVRKALWKAGMKFGAEYALDTYNEIPTAVMVTLTKI